MKLLIPLLLCMVMNTIQAQTSTKSPYGFSKKDIAPLTLQLVAGYAQGWREEVLYHPEALFAHYPNLNHRFWDTRINRGSRGISIFRDANHLLKFIVAGTQTTAIVIKVGDWKNYPRNKRWKKLLADMVKYYGAYKLGFYCSYNLTHQNKFTL